ncbi:hypothetical protein D3C81_796570 [compost metagenome]
MNTEITILTACPFIFAIYLDCNATDRLIFIINNFSRQCPLCIQYMRKSHLSHNYGPISHYVFHGLSFLIINLIYIGKSI